MEEYYIKKRKKKFGPNTDRWMQAEATTTTTTIHMIWCIFEKSFWAYAFANNRFFFVCCYICFWCMFLMCVHGKRIV